MKVDDAVQFDPGKGAYSGSLRQSLEHDICHCIRYHPSIV